MSRTMCSHILIHMPYPLSSILCRHHRRSRDKVNILVPPHLPPLVSVQESSDICEMLASRPRSSHDSRKFDTYYLALPKSQRSRATCSSSTFDEFCLCGARLRVSTSIQDSSYRLCPPIVSVTHGGTVGLDQCLLVDSLSQELCITFTCN